MFKLSLALMFKPLNLNLSFTVNYAENPHRTYNARFIGICSA